MQESVKHEPAIGDSTTLEDDFFSEYQTRLHLVREELDRIHSEEYRKWREQEQWEKGWEEGRKIAIEEDNIKIAHKLLKMGMAVESIAAATNLPVEKIKKL